jgi:hypothetical protein
MLFYFLGCVMAQETVVLNNPKSGLSFYIDLRVEENNRLHFLDWKAGELKEDMFLWISSQETDVGIFTSECPITTCKVPGRWNPIDSDSCSVVSPDIVTSEETHMLTR